MIGTGSRGLALASSLVAEGHAVRAVTRSEERRAELEAVGCECWIGDPDRIGTLRYALDNVTIIAWFLGTASGDNVADLHAGRLRMLLEKATDSTVRGVVYENAGTVGPDVLASGLEEIHFANRMNEIPFRLLEADPRGDQAVWVAAARECIEDLLAGRRRETLV